MKRPANNSIRGQLLAWLLLPLSALWLCSTAFAYYTSVHFANDTYDRELLNSADSVAVRTTHKGGQYNIDLPPYVRAILRHDNTDSFYYQILSPERERISGDENMPPLPKVLKLGLPVFSDGVIEGTTVRVASILVPVPEAESQGETFIVQVAETLKARKRFAQELLVSMVAPEIFFILLGAIAIWSGIARGLEPLKDVQEALLRRSQHDLHPLSTESAPLEVRPLVHSINELLGRLRSDIEAQNRFVANAAHQLRTPLAGLKTYIGLLQGFAKAPEVDQAVGQLDHGVNRMTHMVNRLLALAKAEPNAAAIVPKQSFDLNQVAAASASDLVNVAIDKNIDLAFEGADGPALIEGDPASVSELVMNLVDNALRYTGHGGHVTVRVLANEAVILSVEDDGPGIPIDERERVFERFYRVLGTGEQGSGLGLPIVREIARSHKANVAIETPTSGVGTLLKVTFKRLA